MGSLTTTIAGQQAERFARDYLMQRGLQPLQQNFRRRVGEIDLVLLHDETLVFVEVRYRLTDEFTSPALSVDIHKQRKLVRAAALFLARCPGHSRRTCRFDIVAITGVHQAREQPACQWIRDAFRPQDSAL